MRMIHGDFNQNNISDVVTWYKHYAGPHYRVCIDGHKNNTSKPHRLHTGSRNITVGLLYDNYARHYGCCSNYSKYQGGNTGVFQMNPLPWQNSFFNVIKPILTVIKLFTTIQLADYRWDFTTILVHN